MRLSPRRLASLLATAYFFSGLASLIYQVAWQRLLTVQHGVGAVSIVEAALIPSEVKQVTVVELCGSVITNLRKFPHFVRILRDKRIRMVIDDGRRFLQRTAAQTGVDTRRATEGPGGVPDSTSRRPTERNAVGMPGSAAAVESW